MDISHLQMSIPKSLIIYIVPSFGYLYLFLSAVEVSISDDGCTDLLSTAEHHQESHFFFRQVVFIFILGSFDIFSLVLGQTRDVRYGFHHMELALSQTRDQLVTPTNFVPPLPKHRLHTGLITVKKFCCWVDVYVSLLRACRENPSTKDTRTQQLMVLCRCNSLFMFNDLCGCCLQQRGLAVS